MTTRVLIIYERTGGGHERMADIVEYAVRSAGPGLEVEKVAGGDLLDTSDVRHIVNLWNIGIRRNWLRTVDVLVNFILRIFYLPIFDITRHRAFHEALSTRKPTVLVSTADAYNKMLGSYAAEHRIPFVIVITDISIFPDLVNPNAVHFCYFNETAKLVRHFDAGATYFRRRIDMASSWYDRVRYVFGSYLDSFVRFRRFPVVLHPSYDVAPRNQFVCTALGPLAARPHHLTVDVVAVWRSLPDADDQQPTIVIASGSIGGEFVYNMTRAISRGFPGPGNLLVMCGRDQALAKRLGALRLGDSTITIIPLGYTERVHEILAVADCIVARPSAGMFVECLLAETPIIAITPIPSNDRGAADLIRIHHMGKVLHSSATLIPAIEDVLSGAAVYRDNIRRFLAGYRRSYDEITATLREAIVGGA